MGEMPIFPALPLAVTLKSAFFLAECRLVIQS
jgi:hypothetical protein